MSVDFTIKAKQKPHGCLLPIVLILAFLVIMIQTRSIHIITDSEFLIT